MGGVVMLAQQQVSDGVVSSPVLGAVDLHSTLDNAVAKDGQQASGRVGDVGVVLVEGVKLHCACSAVLGTRRGRWQVGGQGWSEPGLRARGAGVGRRREDGVER